MQHDVCRAVIQENSNPEGIKNSIEQAYRALKMGSTSSASIKLTYLIWYIVALALTALQILSNMEFRGLVYVM